METRGQTISNQPTQRIKKAGVISDSPEKKSNRQNINGKSLDINDSNEINDGWIGINDYISDNLSRDEILRRISISFVELMVNVIIILKRAEEKVKVEFAHICCKFNNHWIFSVDLKSFESIHGVSRIVKLIPDKLATAIAINKEHLSDPKDDGSFLVNLVLKLLTFYQEQAQKNINDQKDSEIVVNKESSSSMKKYNFLDILNQLSHELKAFNVELQTRNIDIIKKQSEKILKIADNLQIFCHVYLDLVHPALIQIERDGNGAETEEKIRELKQKLNEKLAETGHQPLLEEFISLDE